jgi:hypothetical protein
MKRSIFYLIFFLILTELFSCKSRHGDQKTDVKNNVQEVINPYHEKYAGGYMIDVKGNTSDSDAELYVLHKSGSAKWMWITVQSGGQTKIVSEKMGTWDATGDKITISIKGNTGLIVEEYKLMGGKFTFGDRSLKKTD